MAAARRRFDFRVVSNAEAAEELPRISVFKRHHLPPIRVLPLMSMPNIEDYKGTPSLTLAELH